MKEQVLNSPFCKTEFLDLAEIVSEEKITKYKNYAISESSIVNVGNRNFVDYRPDIFIEPEVCLLYTSPSPRDCLLSRMPSSA